MDNVKKSGHARREKHAAKEAAINSFLIQFTYTIVCSIVLTVIYNGLFGTYGNSFFTMMTNFIWIGFYLLAAAAIAFLILYHVRKNKLYFKIMLYILPACFGFAWITLFQRLMYLLSKFISPLSRFASTIMLSRLLFVFLGIAVIAEIVIYFMRVKKINNG